MCDQARSTARHAVAQSAQPAEHLDLIREINREMHLQALNAIIKTTLLGEQGRTLSVLSMHMHAVFQDSSSLVQDTVAVLREVQSHEQGGPEFRAGSTDASGLKVGLEQLVRVHEEFQETVRNAVELAGRQEERLRQARQQMDFLPELAGQLRGLRLELAGWRAELPEAPADESSDETLTGLEQRYTMESEREVHRRMTKPVLASSPEPAGAALPAPAAKAGAEIGDNIELF